MRIARWTLAAALSSLPVLPVLAAEEAGMSAEDQARMQEIFATYASAGPEHRNLDPLVGAFDYTSRFWLMPGADPSEDSGSCEYAWHHGGRYLVQHASGMAMNMEFTGTGIMGYDRYRGEYFSTWVDNLGTGIMTLEGTADASGKVLTFEGTYDDVWMGQQDKWMRMTLSIADANAHKLEMFVKGEDGKVFKNFEIDYTRAKMAAN